MKAPIFTKLDKIIEKMKKPEIEHVHPDYIWLPMDELQRMYGWEWIRKQGKLFDKHMEGIKCNRIV